MTLEDYINSCEKKAEETSVMASIYRNIAKDLRYLDAGQLDPEEEMLKYCLKELARIASLPTEKIFTGREIARAAINHCDELKQRRRNKLRWNSSGDSGADDPKSSDQ